MNDPMKIDCLCSYLVKTTSLVKCKKECHTSTYKVTLEWRVDVDDDDDN